MQQYAHTSIDGSQIVIDANEASALDRHFGAIVDAPRPPDGDTSAMAMRIMYGGYLPQPSYSLFDAQQTLKQCVQKWHGWVKGDTCYPSGIAAIKTYTAIRLDPSKEITPDAAKEHNGLRIPFAALIQASPDVFALMDDMKAQAISLFMRYSNIDPTDNIFNRPGILAIKGLEQNVKSKPLTVDNWLLSVDDARARRIAERLQ